MAFPSTIDTAAITKTSSPHQLTHHGILQSGSVLFSAFVNTNGYVEVHKSTDDGLTWSSAGTSTVICAYNFISCCCTQTGTFLVTFRDASEYYAYVLTVTASTFSQSSPINYQARGSDQWIKFYSIYYASTGYFSAHASLGGYYTAHIYSADFSTFSYSTGEGDSSNPRGSTYFSLDYTNGYGNVISYALEGGTHYIMAGRVSSGYSATWHTIASQSSYPYDYVTGSTMPGTTNTAVCCIYNNTLEIYYNTTLVLSDTTNVPLIGQADIGFDTAGNIIFTYTKQDGTLCNRIYTILTESWSTESIIAAIGYFPTSEGFSSSALLKITYQST